MNDERNLEKDAERRFGITPDCGQIDSDMIRPIAFFDRSYQAFEDAVLKMASTRKIRTYAGIASGELTCVMVFTLERGGFLVKPKAIHDR